MKLFIVESPNKCGKIRSFLDKDFKVVASVGHVRNIPEKGLNIDIENGFKPTYEISKDKKKVVEEIRKLAKESDTIYLATDMDREGESIANSLYELMDKESQKKCTRIAFNEITKKAITKALEETRDIDHSLVDAATARQVLDRLIGYKVSPVLWVAVGRGTSAGRVQSIALRLICDRQKEIDAFKPEDFWFVEALLQCKKGEFWGRVVTKEKENRFLDEKLATNALDKLKTASYTLDKIEKETKKSNPYPPFDTASLQTACSSVFGWSATKSKTIAQHLYEQGKVSYIRSDSYTISEEAMKEVREFIQSHESADYIPSKPNVYTKKSSAASQEAHECIRPTHVNDDGNDISDSDEKKMYQLIRDRFISCQMTPMLVDIVTYNIKASSGHDLVARGQTIKFEGWYKYYKYAKAKDEILPEASEKDKLDLKDIKSTKHSTKPPDRYNDGSLIKKMESEGVGRPSTRDSIIKAIQDKGYVEKQKGKNGFYATPLGMQVSEYLAPHFADFFMDIKYTSSLEEELDEIASGKKKFLGVVQGVYDFLMKHVKESKENMPEKELIKTGSKCTVCKDGEVVEKKGRFGTFYSCSKYPECKVIYAKSEDGKFTVKEKKEAPKTGSKCTVCKKGDIVERSGKFGAFYACNQFPRCKTVYSKTDDGFEVYKGKPKAESE